MTTTTDPAPSASAVPQTQLQLYRLLREQQRPPEDLALVARAYELGCALYSGYFQADGKPFVCHLVGVAGILAAIGLPAEVVAAGLLHNVYTNGDFGDGRDGRVDDRRRRVVREAAGNQVASLIERFRSLRLNQHTIDEHLERLDTRDETDRHLLTMELADYLEKFVDDGVGYFAQPKWVIQEAEAIGDRLIVLAERLGQADLADRLKQSIARLSQSGFRAPAELHPTDGRRYLKLLVPRSCRRRWVVVLRERAGYARMRLARRLKGTFPSLWNLAHRFSRAARQGRQGAGPDARD